MTPPDPLVGLVHGRAGRSRGTAPMRRVVLRFDISEVERIDALRARFPKASRAALVRGLCLLSVSLAEEQIKVTAPAGGAP